MSWANPEWLWCLLIIPLLVGLSVWRALKNRHPSLTFSDTSGFSGLPKGWRSWGVWISPVLQWIVIALVVLALARPQKKNTTIKRNTKGIDIVLALDISTSMRAEDLKPSRFRAAKRVAINFINKRHSDRIGLVVFARKSFTVVPPTLDYGIVKQAIRNTKMGIIEDGTAIGMGIATAVNRLKDSKVKSKVIILLTDGENNSGKIDPETAAELAQLYNIKIYTIGVGTKGMAPYPVDSPVFGRRLQKIKVKIDEKMLKKIASMTGGLYFRATDTKQLQKIYAHINNLERTKVQELIYTNTVDYYMYFLLPAIVLLIGSVITERVIFRTRLE
jgi:Ca-activated chloride channel family protein